MMEERIVSNRVMVSYQNNHLHKDLDQENSSQAASR